MRPAPWAAVALLAALAAGGCGYRLVGRGGPTPVDLGPVDDQGIEPLFGARLRAALAREAVDRGDLSLAEGAAARARLTARVVSVRETAVAFAMGDKPRVYRLEAAADATLADPAGDVRWKALRVQADRTFAAGETVEETQRNKDDALERLTRDLARALLERVSLFLEAEAL